MHYTTYNTHIVYRVDDSVYQNPVFCKLGQFIKSSTVKRQGTMRLDSLTMELRKIRRPRDLTGHQLLLSTAAAAPAFRHYIHSNPNGLEKDDDAERRRGKPSFAPGAIWLTKYYLDPPRSHMARNIVHSTLGMFMHTPATADDEPSSLCRATLTWLATYQTLPCGMYLTSAKIRLSAGLRVRTFPPLGSNGLLVLTMYSLLLLWPWGPRFTLTEPAFPRILGPFWGGRLSRQLVLTPLFFRRESR
ncbi:hypothetical protein LZ30DRAFT_410809 [Colletotrichum cereale]|nr:hypothetical protein LZ30DRAFT_410809 [Colletotrichum cereale]